MLGMCNLESNPTEVDGRRTIWEQTKQVHKREAQHLLLFSRARQANKLHGSTCFQSEPGLLADEAHAFITSLALTVGPIPSGKSTD